MPANTEASTKAWWRNLNALAQFVHDHGRPPKQREMVQFDGSILAVGKWLMHQRQRGHLDEQQRQALNLVLAGQALTRDEKWRQHLELVRSYIRTHGAPPPIAAVVDGHPIGEWVHDQRKAFRTGALSGERVAALEDVPGWRWAVDGNEFEAGMKHLSEYVREHGTGWVPERYVSPDGYPLGRWAQERRRQRVHDSPERIQLLRTAGFSYEAPPRRLPPALAARAHKRSVWP